jgi:hypothetical protein
MFETAPTAPPDLAAYANLSLWAEEIHKFAEFIHLPDQDSVVSPRALESLALELLDDTYDANVSRLVISMEGVQMFGFSNSTGVDFALTWPLYQARALHYASEHQLPLVSDDPSCIPPFPTHPSVLTSSKGLAQQLAVEALSLLLPPFRSVEPDQIAEFRAEVQPLVRPFRHEMVKFTADVNGGIASGASETELKQAIKNLVESRVLPALQDLSKQLAVPGKSFHKIAIDLGEAALATAASTQSPALGIGWAVIRGLKIASEYAQLYVDRQAVKRSGLSFLLRVNERYGADLRDLSKWDRRDWRCSGSVDIPDPGAPILPINQKIGEIWESKLGFKPRTVRRLFQMKTMSMFQAVNPNMLK